MVLETLPAFSFHLALPPPPNTCPACSLGASVRGVVKSVGGDASLAWKEDVSNTHRTPAGVAACLAGPRGAPAWSAGRGQE